MSPELRHTPLEAEHTRLGAKLVPFAGWSMPVQYQGGITSEHLAVRAKAGVFDISHMGQFFVRGPEAQSWLNLQLTNNLERLNDGQGQYTLMLNERGGVIDDLIVYRLSVQEYLLVVNAAKIDEDRAWLEAACCNHKLGIGVDFSDESDAWAGLAVQGPDAARLLPDLPPRNGVIQRDGVIICRTGYTGEDGFELFCPAAAAVEWWRRFLEAGAAPCGLGARDTLRLEMCYPLNGSDLSPDRTPLEAGLGFFVDLEKPSFTGHDRLAAQKAAGDHDRLVALRLVEKGPPLRSHYRVLSGGQAVGELTSGGISPSLGWSIGLAYVPAALAKPGTRLEIDVRGRALAAEVVRKPFLRK